MESIKILVPIDFSNVSDNALAYASELAKDLDAKLVLMHVFNVPVQIAETTIPIISFSELEKSSIDALHKYYTDKKKDLGITKEVELVVKAGFVSDEIVEFTHSNSIDFIVMGITGADKKINEFIGSNTTNLIKKAKVPVLVTPAGVQYKKPKKIALAFDYKNNVDTTQIDIITFLAKKMGAQIQMLNVVKPETVPSYEEATSSINLKNSFQGVDVSYHFPLSDNITDEINSFVDVHHSDWLVMFPHSYNFFEKLFHKSNTKQMAFHTHIPLLSIHQ